MKDANLIIRIPEPCHEDWNTMQPDEKGRFCSSCCKSVVDFSGKSDAEIRDILMEYKDRKVCGHFRKTEVDRPLKITIDLADLPRNMSLTRTFALSLLIVFGTTLFSCYDPQSKKINAIEISGKLPELTNDDLVGKVETVADTTKKDNVNQKTIQKKGGEECFLKGDVVVEEKTDSLNFPVKDDLSKEIYYTTGLVAIDYFTQDSTATEITDSLTIDNPKEDPVVKGRVQEMTFSIYPNPAKEEFTLSYHLVKRADVKVDIVDLKGTLIKNVVNIAAQHEGKYKLPVPVNELANGAYLVNFFTNGERLTKQLIVGK